jgi:hypothetical protein
MRTVDLDVLTQAADFLVKFGFLLVGLVLTFLVAPMISKVWKAKTFAIGTVCFGLAFIIAFGVIDLVQKIAPSLISSQRPILSGVVLGITDGYQVQIQSDRGRSGQAYTKREFDQQARSLYNFPFILVTTDAPTCLAIGIASTDPESDRIAVFNITPISTDDMASNQDLIAKVIQRQDTFKLQVWRERNQHQIGDVITFSPLDASASDCGTSQGQGSSLWHLVTSAFAQPVSGVNIDDFAARLRSDDLFTRRNTRIELSRRGIDAFGMINQLLDSKDYRLQLGALVGFSEMDGESRKQIPTDLVMKARRLLNHSDKTMRDTAVRVLGQPAFCYQEEDRNKRPDQRYLALCHWSKEQCEETRGPNRRPGISQSMCEPVDLTKAAWDYLFTWRLQRRVV